jgi:acetoin utilization deacetylase AcuC-like enzyme
MKVFYSETHSMHNPPFEILDGGERVPSFETSQRIDSILFSLKAAQDFSLASPDDFGMEPIRAVHDQGYLEFLQTAYSQWINESANYEHSALTPATFPPGGIGKIPKSVLGKAGHYMMDLSAPIGAHTFDAAYQAAQCALSGARNLINGSRSTFALIRPPGHHAGPANCGGYCYLNNAAISANYLCATEHKVAILDVDYHAGNGTQEIFYDRKDVFTISIHADPDEEYPYYLGYLAEIGRGEGLGFHRNFPLPLGSADQGYLTALDQAMELIRDYQPDFLVVSLGLDLAKGDPLGKFQITDDGIGQIGKAIANIKLPTLIVLEGGYDIPNLGSRVVRFLENFKA